MDRGSPVCQISDVYYDDRSFGSFRRNFFLLFTFVYVSGSSPETTHSSLVARPSVSVARCLLRSTVSCTVTAVCLVGVGTSSGKNRVPVCPGGLQSLTPPPIV